ncbi:MAG: RNA polymerase sigma factor [Pseudomonadota bacterium]
MNEATLFDMTEQINRLYRLESRRVLATLIRLLGDFDLAEEALHEAFMAALRQWPQEGIPGNPVAWLVSAGRFKAIDQLRRGARLDLLGDAFDEQLDAGLGVSHEPANDEPDAIGVHEGIEDDRLRLVFICCHPLLTPEARIALTLREVCDLTTEEIARAFLASPTTIAQRIVRAKAKIRDAAIPYEVPGQSQLPERLDSVLQVIYLVFNEGYSASDGSSLTRHDLCAEAIRLCRLVLELLPDAEVQGLLALMLLHESRRTARSDATGDIVLLDEQDRSMWNQDLIAEGVALVDCAFASGSVGAYSLQAAIVAVHAKAMVSEDTDWTRIVALYDLLWRSNPTPIVELNRAVAVSMSVGPAAALLIVDELLQRGVLPSYHPLYAARADFYRRLGRHADALADYRVALQWVKQEPERRFLERRINEMLAKSTKEK